MAGPNVSIKLTEAQQKNIAVAVLIAGLVGYGYWNYLYSPLVKKHKEKTEVLTTKQKELKDAREMVLKYPEFLQRSASINRRADFIDRRLPFDRNISGTISEVTRKSTEANIRIMNFIPEKERDKGEYMETRIKLEFKTNFVDLGNFLTKLGYIERLTTPADVVITRYKPAANESVSNNIMTVMNIKIYSFKEAPK